MIKQDRYGENAVPEKIKKFTNFNEVKTFVFNKSYTKGEKTENEFENLWVVENKLTINNEMPFEICRGEVINFEEKHISPIENAITVT